MSMGLQSWRQARPWIWSVVPLLRSAPIYTQELYSHGRQPLLKSFTDPRNTQIKEISGQMEKETVLSTSHV
jgi:hypothetical protein